MIILSVFAVVAIILFPYSGKKEALPEAISLNDSLYFKHEAPIFDTTVYSQVINDSARVIIRRIEPRPITGRQPASVEALSQDTTVSEDKSAAPIQIQIVEPPKSFDWKGTVTWIIGAINGLVLVVLNIKNLIVKKNT
jgi:hypothetical protein